MKLTVDIIDDFIQGLDLSGDVLSFSDDGTNTTLIVNDTFHARKGMILDVDGLPFTILSIVFATSITVAGLPAAPFNYTVPLPFYFHGTPIATNSQIHEADHKDKVPMIYLHEILKEKDKDIFSSVKRDSDVRLFFLDSANFDDWTTDDHYSKRLLGLNALVDAFKSQALESRLFSLDETEFSRVNHAKWGTVQDSKGHIKNIFDDELTGVELSLTLPLIDCEDKVITPRLPCPDLQERWDGSTDPQKNIFVDDNETEILSFIDDLNNMVISDETQLALNLIAANSGVVTDKEKFFLNAYINTLVASGEWLTMKSIIFLSGMFADSIANRTDLISGSLFTASAGDFTIISGTAPTGGNDSFGTYNKEIAGAKTFLSGGAKIDFSATGTYTFDANQSTDLTQVHFPSTRALLVTEETSSGNLEFFVNGVSQKTGAVTAGAVLNSYVVPDTSSLFYINDAAANQLTIYAAFEELRTQLNPEILYNIPQKTGQEFSYRDGDDAWIEDNYLDHFHQAQSFWNGTRPELVDFLTLKQNNAFGNPERFTDNLGTQIYAAGLTIDHYTGDMWFSTQQGGAIWNTQIDNGLGTLFGGSQAEGGFPNWRLCSLNDQITLKEANASVGRNILNPTDGSFYGDLWTSTTRGDTTTNALFSGSNQRILAQLKTVSDAVIFIRKHY